MRARWRTIVSILTASAALLVLTAQVRGGPPFVTDDPEPVDYKHWEFYVASTYAQENEGSSAVVPMFEVNYGALPDLQLHLVAPFALDAPSGGDTHYGYGDTEVGAKYRFIQETDRVPQVAIFPLVEIPTGDESRGLGNGKPQYFFPIWLQKSWDKWTTYGGGGWWLNSGEDNKDFWRAGWLLQRDISDALTLGGEIFFQSADTIDSGEEIAFNVGGIWNLNERSHILFSVGRDIRGPNRFACYVGFQLTP